MGMTLMCVCDTHKVQCNDFGHFSSSGKEIYDEGIDFLIWHSECSIRIGIDQWYKERDPAYFYETVKYDPI